MNENLKKKMSLSNTEIIFYGKNNREVYSKFRDILSIIHKIRQLTKMIYKNQCNAIWMKINLKWTDHWMHTHSMHTTIQFYDSVKPKDELCYLPTTGRSTDSVLRSLASL